MMTMILHLRRKEQCFGDNFSLPTMLFLVMVLRFLPLLIGGERNILTVGFIVEGYDVSGV